MQEESKKPSGLSWSTPSKAAAVKPVAPLVPATQAPLLPAESAESFASPLGTQAPVYAGLLVGGIIVGVLLATAWSSYNKGKPIPGTATAATQSTVGAKQPTAAATSVSRSTVASPLVVGDQPAGSQVTISWLNIANPTWVVVYVSREGKPGNALGARLFFAGDQGGQVALLRNTEPGQRYFVGLSVDNGDRVFSLSKDKPLADADGGPLWATFIAR